MHVKARDDGFTLIEALVAIVILGVITLALGNVVIGFVKNTDATSDRLALSHDAQITAAYFATDVATVGVRDYSQLPDGTGKQPFKPSIQLAASYNAGGFVCGSAATPTAVVRFLSDEWYKDASGKWTVRAVVVAYYLSGHDLHRLKCVGGTPTSNALVAHNVDPATPSVSCSTTCTSTTVPQQATLSFTVTKPSVGGYPIKLMGQRRQS
jgi:prepilin-type N-terminal cleavage/methylation domain-containing protein